jgi:hypothetical protein
MADPNNPSTPGILNEWGDPRGNPPVEDGLALYGGGDHTGPAQPDTSEAKDTFALGSSRGRGYDFTTADLPR